MSQINMLYGQAISVTVILCNKSILVYIYIGDELIDSKFNSDGLISSVNKKKSWQQAILTRKSITNTFQ